MNGYRLSALLKDPVAVDRSLVSLAVLLTDARAHMTLISRHDLADRLDALLVQLRASGQAIDDAIDHAFREVTGAAADACAEAAATGGMGFSADRNTQVRLALL